MIIGRAAQVADAISAQARKVERHMEISLVCGPDSIGSEAAAIGCGLLRYVVSLSGGRSAPTPREPRQSASVQLRWRLMCPRFGGRHMRAWPFVLLLTGCVGVITP